MGHKAEEKVFIEPLLQLHIYNENSQEKTTQIWQLLRLGSDSMISWKFKKLQIIKFKTINSDSLSIKCGVPQRSLLGPLFFLIYMNYICLSSNILNFILFADDTHLLLIGDYYIYNQYHNMNQELINVITWLSANKLSLNVRETR